MAEYWKSAPRFWCKQCKIFIRDTPFEKTQHEASPKHQGSLKRFLREIHKDSDRQQRETQRAKSEVERLRQAVGGGSSAAKDDSASAPSKRPAPAPKPAQKPASVEERKKQMAQLAEMGVAIPQEYRADMALAGEWQTLSETKIESQDAEGAAKSIGVRKRKHEGDDEEEEHAPEQPVSKAWGSRTRTYPGARDDDEDLDALLASTKDLKKTKTPAPATETEVRKSEPVPLLKSEDEASAPKAEEVAEPAEVKTEETGEASAPLTEEKPQNEDAPGVMFKKRKPKAMRK
ncbi:hypothetical protein N7492_001209 [Penicillium capsulatum]|uniref:U1-type domain-containing protein n=1 Tax=Penicillium capsulatum TaxID=69766 RepID=A0A9W9LZG8_9EURO|nr:hypothetical protein N7492_001209 [Penicillium capsulatum]KAJ6129733.1 hypothetical protein N7512_002513 [Penicillium capsulatum]